MIVDDSGSMAAADGHQVKVKDDGRIKFKKCSRWVELTGNVRFHAGLARAAQSKTEFRILNTGEPLIIGEQNGDAVYDELLQALNSVEPQGGTPLCKHITAVVQQIRENEELLRARNQKASLIIYTDGEASDGDVSEALAELADLPVWVVLCLCTDEQHIVNYWNYIDRNLELNLEILDDFRAEAKEISQVNPWFTYGLPLHQLRQFGINIRELDMLDERALDVEQIRDVCLIIFGGESDAIPSPGVDPKPFIDTLTALNRREPRVWNPITRRVAPWIDPARIAQLTRSDKCVIS